MHHSVFFQRPARALWHTCLLASALASTGGHATEVPPTGLVFGPYKHLLTHVDPRDPQARIRTTGTPQRLADATPAALLPGSNNVTLAFASGECGQERWTARDATVLHADGSSTVEPLALDAASVVRANLASLHAAGYRTTISTGGEGNLFTCASDAGMDAFIARYDGPGLLGFDFDIEHTQTLDNIQSLVARIKVAQAKRPTLRWSFTLPTFAASDASRASLNPLGLQTLAAIRTAGLDAFIINLMVMDYGKASPAACVVRDGRCDMAASAIQAARNLHAVHGVPMHRIALTPMIGVNDVVENVFTPEDAEALARFARKEQLAGLHFWSLDRDTPCPGGATAVSPTCSSLNAHPALAFSRAFAQGLRP